MCALDLRAAGDFVAGVLGLELVKLYIGRVEAGRAMYCFYVFTFGWLGRHDCEILLNLPCRSLRMFLGGYLRWTCSDLFGTRLKRQPYQI